MNWPSQRVLELRFRVLAPRFGGGGGGGNAGLL